MSGSMSGERKPSDAAWPKQPRLSSTLPRVEKLTTSIFGPNYLGNRTSRHRRDVREVPIGDISISASVLSSRSAETAAAAALDGRSQSNLKASGRHISSAHHVHSGPISDETCHCGHISVHACCHGQKLCQLRTLRGLVEEPSTTKRPKRPTKTHISGLGQQLATNFLQGKFDPSCGNQPQLLLINWSANGD